MSRKQRDASLAGMGVLVTRPEPQNTWLCERLQQHGAIALGFPCVVIEPREPDQAMRDRALALNDYDGVIFVSMPAAEHGLAILHDYWPQWPVGVHWVALGESTAARVRRDSPELEVHQPEQADSEGVLSLAICQAVRGQKWLIIRGGAGRELLAEQLRARGAAVDYMDVYRRRTPQFTKEQQRQAVDMINKKSQFASLSWVYVVISSAEILDSFQAAIHEAMPPQSDWVASINLLVVSQRIAEIAKKLGFDRVTVCQGAGNDAIIGALCRIKQRQHNQG